MRSRENELKPPKAGTQIEKEAKDIPWLLWFSQFRDGENCSWKVRLIRSRSWKAVR